MAGLAPTDRQVRLAVFEAWAVPDGRCAERWLHLDRWQVLYQLGQPAAAAVCWDRPPVVG